MKVAFVFPGQGSQSIGMLDLWVDNSTLKETMMLASDVLEQDLISLISNGPVEDLNLTINTQPIMLAVGFSLFSVWINSGGSIPLLMAGHSLGEYTALVASESISFSDALRIVRVRAEAMQSAVPIGIGAMAAIIGLESDKVTSICNSNTNSKLVVEAVNFNTPTQTVIAGDMLAVEKACCEAKENGAKRAILLPVSAPFHSSLLKPASKVLSNFLDGIDIKKPKIDIINNVDACIIKDPSIIRDSLVRQSWKPVRWVETIKKMTSLGVTHIIECGPGNVLSTLVKKIDSNLVVKSIKDPSSMNNALELLNQ